MGPSLVGCLGNTRPSRPTSLLRHNDTSTAITTNHEEPWKVSGPGYSTEIKSVEDCKELAMFNSHVYDVPMPASGAVTVTPGNQLAVTLDAAQVASGGAATVFHARESGAPLTSAH